MDSQITSFYFNTEFKKRKRIDLKRSILRYKSIYGMIIPALVFYIIFHYFPMYGIVIAFKKYMVNQGILGSPWVGFKNFERIFSLTQFWDAFRNTIVIAGMKTLFNFPFPIILALLINELRFSSYKRVMQTVYTFPHFLSWIIVSGIMFNIFSNEGVINNLIVLCGGERRSLLVDKSFFRWFLVITEAWKEAGWGTIIYLAAIEGISPTYYEAATIDGANRWHKIVYITWPGIRSMVVVMLILRIGNMMDAGFMQILNLYNPAVYEVSDIIDTYIYRITFQSAPDYGVSTAVGIFKGITNMILLVTADRVIVSLGERGITN